MTLPVFLKLAPASERLFWSIEFDATPSKIQIYDEYGNINLEYNNLYIYNHLYSIMISIYWHGHKH